MCIIELEINYFNELFLPDNEKELTQFLKYLNTLIKSFTPSKFII